MRLQTLIAASKGSSPDQQEWGSKGEMGANLGLPQEKSRALSPVALVSEGTR